MPMPKSTAVLVCPGMGGALALSVLAHALVAAGVYNWYRHAGPPPSVGRQRGGLTVQLAIQPKAQLPSHAPQHPQTPVSHAPAGTDVRPQAPAPLRAIAAPPPTMEAASTADARHQDAPLATQTAPSAVAATPAPAASQAGATFASMFAPVISRPIGRGRWMASVAPAPTPLGPDVQRLQAMDNVRRQLLDRITPLSQQLQNEGLAGACKLRIALAQQTAQLSCTQEADQARIWPALQGLVRAEPPDSHSSQADLCWQLEGRQITSTSCDASTPAPTSAARP